MNHDPITHRTASDHSGQVHDAAANGRSVDVDRLAWRIEADGIAAVSGASLEIVARAAVCHGASPLLAALLTGADEPAAARERAFGRLAMHLARFEHRGLVLAA
jgi:hypothetical protein